ncbi:MAG: 50S ribosomal protein L35 [Armatimonadetes bacterium]|jgi:large subunit ribosomal protein L35|nr:50S ribosomal protein L35 [Armatimonadota bacterium]
MPKLKTNKTAVKRFKITGTGKITRRASHNSHQFLHKKASRKRRLELEPEVFQGEQGRMRALLVLRLTNAQKTGSKRKNLGPGQKRDVRKFLSLS